MSRLDNLPTLRINPEQRFQFNYAGKSCQGLGGDTIATALYAGGTRIFSRSLKYHRPRGLYSLDGECSNTCMEVNGLPNVRTENTLLKAGMSVTAQNVKGTPDKDFMGFMDKMDWAMPSGFYYRTMHKPAQVWPVALKQVRKVAGIGKISPEFQMPGTYDEIYPRADVCVIGGGPAGILAAAAAAEKGLRVILLEARPWLGGFFDYRTATYNEDTQLYQRARQLADRIGQMNNVRIFTHTAMVGAYNNNLITAIQIGSEFDSFDKRYIEIRSESVIVATGCIERPLLFENNERPGVMQISCAHRLAHTYGILAGREAVFSIGHDLGLEAAIDLHDQGLKIACVADIREDGQDTELIGKLQARSIPYMSGWVATEAHGKTAVDKVTLGTNQGTLSKEFYCDLLVASAGLTPITGPLTMAQAGLEYDSHTGFFLAQNLPAKMHAAGRMLGLSHPWSIETSGTLAGLLAAADCGAEVDLLQDW